MLKNILNPRRCVLPIKSVLAKRFSLNIQKIPRVLLNQPKTHITTLPSGIRVVSQYVPGQLSDVAVLVSSGSRFESAQTNGVAHFLEHLIFKGTNRRSRISLEREIEDHGSHLNAYTAREQTVYWATVLKQDVKFGLDILSDILVNSKLSPEAIEEEKYVILREMEEVAKNLEEVIFDRLHLSAYPESALGYTILGPPKNIENMEHKWILDYIQKNYTADRIVVAGAGDFHPEAFAQHVKKYFKNVRPAAPQPPTLNIPQFEPGQMIEGCADIPLTHCVIAYEGCNWNDPFQPAFMVLQQYIGSFDRELSNAMVSAQSEIVESLESTPICMFSAFNTSYMDTGLFGAYFTCPHNSAPFLLKKIITSLWNIAYYVSPSKLELAKSQVKNTLFGNTDDSSAICEEIGRQVLVHGRRIPAAELFLRIDEVTPDTLREIVWKNFYGKPCAIAAIGANKNDLNKSLKSFHYI